VLLALEITSGSYTAIPTSQLTAPVTFWTDLRAAKDRAQSLAKPATVPEVADARPVRPGEPRPPLGSSPPHRSGPFHPTVDIPDDPADIQLPERKNFVSGLGDPPRAS
jgi:hypothetical protein